MTDRAKSSSRIVIQTASARPARRGQAKSRQMNLGKREGLVALTVVAAAALATFVILFITSRPYDPMNSTVAPTQSVPARPLVTQPSPKSSSTISTSAQEEQPAGEQSRESSGGTAAVPDDAGIQSQIERTLNSDPTLSKLDVSTLVDGGKVTLMGSVKSAELRQQVERAVRSVKGVVGVDNQLVVAEVTP